MGPYEKLTSFWATTIVSIVACYLLFTYTTDLYANLHKQICPYDKQPAELRYQCFYSEQAFYYSYYRKFVSANNSKSLYELVTVDEEVQYPTTINPFQRFNIGPELIFALINKYIYTPLSIVFGTTFITENDILEKDINFLLYAVFYIQGALMVAIYLCGLTVTKSYISGIVAASLCYLHFFWVSRAQNHPFLKENYAMPLLWLQVSLICNILRTSPPSSTSALASASSSSSSSLRWSCFFLFLSTTSWFSFWQFAQFPTFLQSIALFITYLLKLIPNSKTLVYIYLVQIASIIGSSVFMFGNVMVLISFLSNFLVVALLYLLLFPSRDSDSDKPQKPGNYFVFIALVLLKTVAVFLLSILSKLYVSKALINAIDPEIDDDSHVLSILVEKLSLTTTSFDTNYIQGSSLSFLSPNLVHLAAVLKAKGDAFMNSIYFCAEVYDFMPAFPLNSMWNTMLIPTALVALLIIAIKIICDSYFLHHNRIKTNEFEIIKNNGVICFFLGQTCAFILLGLSMMRMLPFLTPTFSLMVSFLFTFSVSENLLPLYLTTSSMNVISRNDYEGKKNDGEHEGIATLGNESVLEETQPSSSTKGKKNQKSKTMNHRKNVIKQQIEKNKKSNPKLSKSEQEKQATTDFAKSVIKVLYFLFLCYSAFHFLDRYVYDDFLEKTTYVQPKRLSSDEPTSQLVKWIRAKTTAEDSFSGGMVISSQIKLYTERKISVHPHAENAEMRDRYRYLYQIHNRIPDKDVHAAMTTLQTNYLVLHTCNSRCVAYDSSDTAAFNGLSQNRSSHLQPWCTTVHHWPNGKNGKPKNKYFRKVFTSSDRSITVLKVKALKDKQA